MASSPVFNLARLGLAFVFVSLLAATSVVAQVPHHSSGLKQRLTGCADPVTGGCPSADQCCSRWGFCGTSADYCGSHCFSGACFQNNTIPCGGGIVGSGTCSDNSLCCSSYGWCGNDSQHCGAGNCFGGPCNSASPSASPSASSSLPPSSSPVVQGTCGNGTVGNKICANSNYCCSYYGFCGSTDAYCGNGCLGGPCTSPSVSPSSAASPSISISPSVSPSKQQTVPSPSPSSSRPASSSQNPGSSASPSASPTPSIVKSSSSPSASVTPQASASATKSSSSTSAPSPSPSSSSSGTVTGTCGSGVLGNKICADGTCCSRYGFCGTGDDYCGTNCVGGPCNSPIPAVSPSATPGPFSSTLSLDQFRCIYPNLNDTLSSDRYIALQAAVAGFSLYSNKLEMAAFLGELGHESANLTALREYCALPGADPSCLTNYDNPSWCTYNSPGQHYFGRGFIQLTWSCNYEAAGVAIGVDLLDNPDLVATNLTIAWQTSVWFWTTNGCDVQAQQGNYAGVTKIINPIECVGSQSVPQQSRVGIYENALSCLGLPAPNSTLLFC